MSNRGVFAQSGGASIPAKFDINALKPLWLKRLRDIEAAGDVPVIDIESSYAPRKMALTEFVNSMDRLGVAIICLSSMVDGNAASQGEVWNGDVANLMKSNPERFIPTTVSAIYPAFTGNSKEFLDKTFQHAIDDGYALLGEFEFRHYPSPPEYRRGEMYRDVHVPIDGEHGHRLFRFSSETGLAFQIHYEIEDIYLPALEKMLAAYPKAKVIWCHFTQVRYASRAGKYNPGYITQMIDQHPGLHFDLAIGGYDSIYPGSGERHARLWEDQSRLKPEWKSTIEKYPYRFLAALDLGGDRMDQLAGKMKNLRRILANFDKDTQTVLAYRAAWKLIFGEAI